MSLFSLMPIMMSISFYFLFGESLKKAEFIGITLSVIAVIIIALSRENEKKVLPDGTRTVHPIWACLLLIGSVSIIVL